MGWVWAFARSSVGAKAIMGASGLALLLFTLVHMAGNLQVFLGQEVYNHYAATLKGMPEFLWVARTGLLVVFVAHIIVAFILTGRNTSARPVAYSLKKRIQASLASQQMIISGLFVLTFVAYHLLHFTLGVTHPEHHALEHAGHHDVYSMFVLGFQNPTVSAFYIASMLLLGAHLSHGVSSLFQSLGFNHPKYKLMVSAAGPVVAALIVLGNIAMPIAVLTGIIELPPERVGL